MSSLALVFIALVLGHPTQVSCDADVNPPPGITVPAGYVVDGWARLDGSEIHFSPEVCRGSYAPVASRAFAKTFNVMAHETWHARGVLSEGCAELFARLAPFDLFPRVWRKPAPWTLPKYVADYSDTKPPEYRSFDLTCLPALLSV
jgi:hypothetical protein